VSLKAEANGTRHNTKPTRRSEEVPDADEGRAGKCKKMTTTTEEAPDVDDDRAGKCKMMTTTTEEAPDADDDRAGKCKMMTTTTEEVPDADDSRAGKCRMMTTRKQGNPRRRRQQGGEVQNDDDDGRGRATTLGEEVRASADIPANGEKWGLPEQPVQLLRPHAPQRAHPKTSRPAVGARLDHPTQAVDVQRGQAGL
jgi:hypothetical protein